MSVSYETNVASSTSTATLEPASSSSSPSRLARANLTPLAFKRSLSHRDLAGSPIAVAGPPSPILELRRQESLESTNPVEQQQTQTSVASTSVSDQVLLHLAVNISPLFHSLQNFLLLSIFIDQK